MRALLTRNSSMLPVALALSVSFQFGMLLTVHAQEPVFDPDDVVHLLQEPRHRIVQRDGGVFLLDVQINPGDASYPHTHNQPILLTYISDAAGPRGGEVVSRTDYASKPLTHVVANEGPGLRHIMAMVNDNPGVASNNQDQPSGVDADPVIENPWFRAYRLELRPGEATGQQTHLNPTAIILGSEGVVQVTRPDGIRHELDQPGDWAWRSANTTFSIRNVGDTSCTVVINESRRPISP